MLISAKRVNPMASLVEKGCRRQHTYIDERGFKK